MNPSSTLVNKLWRLCAVLRKDGITYQQYVTELTYLLFLKMVQERKDEEGRIAKGYRWGDLLNTEGPERLKLYREILTHLGNTAKDKSVRAIFDGAATFIREPVNLAMLVSAIFGESFLHAFRYLLAPSLGEYRSHFYPDIKTRSEYLAEAAQQFGHRCPAGFANVFSDQGSFTQRLQFLVKIADQATRKVVPLVIAAADRECREHGFEHPHKQDCEKAYNQLKTLVPATNVKSLADIVNAGWRLQLTLVSGHLPRLSRLERRAFCTI